jgi:predicted ArsR family transcriptional regulator
VNQRLILEIGKSQRLSIINKLKRTQGLAVGELAEMLDMSYMGIKQHCLDLEKDGYLDTWRRAKPVGRPELVYRLTQRAHELFPVACNQTTIELLESARKLYGPTAPEKLLFTIFQKKAEHYAARVKGDNLVDRAGALARLRDQEGCMADFSYTENGGPLCIIEHHCPILDLLRAFPMVAKLEAEIFQRLLNVPVQREETSASGLYRCTFTIHNRQVDSEVCKLSD